MKIKKSTIAKLKKMAHMVYFDDSYEGIFQNIQLNSEKQIAKIRCYYDSLILIENVELPQGIDFFLQARPLLDIPVNEYELKIFDKYLMLNDVEVKIYNFIDKIDLEEIFPNCETFNKKIFNRKELLSKIKKSEEEEYEYENGAFYCCYTLASVLKYSNAHTVVIEQLNSNPDVLKIDGKFYLRGVVPFIPLKRV